MRQVEGSILAAPLRQLLTSLFTSKHCHLRLLALRTILNLAAEVSLKLLMRSRAEYELVLGIVDRNLVTAFHRIANTCIVFDVESRVDRGELELVRRLAVGCGPVGHRHVLRCCLRRG